MYTFVDFRLPGSIYFAFCNHGNCMPCIETEARRGGAEVAGWTLDRKIQVRFPAYPHRVWAL